MMMCILSLMFFAFLFHLFLSHIELLFYMLRKVGVTLSLLLRLKAFFFLLTASRGWGTKPIFTFALRTISSSIAFWLIHVDLRRLVSWWLYVCLLPNRSLVLSYLIVPHLEIIWHHLLIVGCCHHVEHPGVCFYSALGIGVDRAAFSYLLGMSCYAVIVGEISSMADVAQGARVDFVHHWVIQHWVGVDLRRDVDLAHRILQVLVLRLRRELALVVLNRRDYVFYSFIGVLLWEWMIWLDSGDSTVGLIDWTCRPSLDVFATTRAEDCSFHRRLYYWVIIRLQVI